VKRYRSVFDEWTDGQTTAPDERKKCLFQYRSLHSYCTLADQR